MEITGIPSHLESANQKLVQCATFYQDKHYVALSETWNYENGVNISEFLKSFNFFNIMLPSPSRYDKTYHIIIRRDNQVFSNCCQYRNFYIYGYFQGCMRARTLPNRLFLIYLSVTKRQKISMAYRKCGSLIVNGYFSV